MDADGWPQKIAPDGSGTLSTFDIGLDQAPLDSGGRAQGQCRCGTRFVARKMVRAMVGQSVLIVVPSTSAVPLGAGPRTRYQRGSGS
jgi:hypothetical protein